MNKLAVAIAFVIASLGMAHAAGPKISSARPKSAVAPSPGMLKRYLASAKGTRIAPSRAPNSMAQRIMKAVRANPSKFTRIRLGRQGIDHGRTAYIPKSPVKGLPGNTAFILSQSIAGPRFTSKVQLPRF